MDSIISPENRRSADPASPSNLERLEEVFATNSLMMKHFVYPSEVSHSQIDEACRILYRDYNVYADKSTSRAYAASLARKEMIGEDDASVVLVMRDHPALKSEYIRHTLGNAPEMPERISEALCHNELNRPCVVSSEEVLLTMADEL